MNANALSEFEDECRKILECQRKCAYCNATFATLKELVKHLKLECPVKKAEGLIL